MYESLTSTPLSLKACPAGSELHLIHRREPGPGGKLVRVLMIV